MTSATAPITAPSILQTEVVEVAAIRLRTPRDGMRENLPPALEELSSAFGVQKIAPAGPRFAPHLELASTHFHFDACVPVASPILAADRVQPGSLPARTIVRTLSRGPSTHLPQAWAEFRAWAVAHQLPPDTEVVERSLVPPSDTLEPNELQTKLVWPLIREEANKQ